MQDLQTTLVILVLVGFIALLIVGATNKVVIYFNMADFLMSFAPWGTLLVTYILISIYQKEGTTTLSGTQTFIKYAGGLVAALFFIASIRLSIIFNKSTGIGIIVGLFKVITALLGTVVIASQIAKIFSKESTLKDAVAAAMVISFFVWIGKKLINGEQVYIAKGWALPDSMKLVNA